MRIICIEMGFPLTLNRILGVSMAKLPTHLGRHVVLLVLASTNFTIVPGVGDGNFQWEYFRHLSQSG